MLAFVRRLGLGGGGEVEGLSGVGSSQGGLGEGLGDKRRCLGSLSSGGLGAGWLRSLVAASGGGGSPAGRGARWPRCRVGSRGALGC